MPLGLLSRSSTAGTPGLFYRLWGASCQERLEVGIFCAEQELVAQPLLVLKSVLSYDPGRTQLGRLQAVANRLVTNDSEGVSDTVHAG